MSIRQDQLPILKNPPPRPAATEVRGDGPALLDLLLSRQQQSSAAEQFSRDHTGAQAKYDSKLLPVLPPGEGQQYHRNVASGCAGFVGEMPGLDGLRRGFRRRVLFGFGVGRLPRWYLKSSRSARAECLAAFRASKAFK